MKDDRLPIVLVVLDGLGDRPSETLDGRTPSESAQTPVLDELTTRGMSGVHVPFGPGRATSSETAHWSLFGFESVAFPGRAAIEALGVGLQPPSSVPMFHLALRSGDQRDGAIFLGARARPGEDDENAADLFASIANRSVGGVGFQLLPLRTGECVLVAHGAASRDVSDSDSLFDHIHPWMRPVALRDATDRHASAAFAETLQQWLLESRRILTEQPVNQRRRSDGLPALDVPVTKWASYIDPAMPSFAGHVGLRGGAVTDTALYRGLARILDMKFTDLVYDASSPARDMARRIASASDLLNHADFVHVHIKATDEAGHSKKPEFKRDIISAVDEGLEQLLTLSGEAIVAVTGDHATPSTGSLLHSGDPTPFVVAGPGVAPDELRLFGERHALKGTCGRLAASDIMPFLAGVANRPFFKGYRPGAAITIALPNDPEPMPPS